MVHDGFDGRSWRAWLLCFSVLHNPPPPPRVLVVAVLAGLPVIPKISYKNGWLRQFPGSKLRSYW